MAHELEILPTGVASHAYVGQTPWHSLGVEVPSDLTPEQMLKAAGLDWTVSAVPAFAEIAGKQVDISRSALIRDTDNRILDVITPDWNPMQNIDAFEFFNDFVAAGDMSMHTAGSLKNGKIVWALAKVDESFELFGGDKVDSYLLFTNPHSYGNSIDVRFTPIRVVCNNTLSMSLGAKAKQMVKVSHRREFDAEQVKLALGVAREKLDTYKETAAFLGSKRYTNETLVEYFTRVFPVSGSKQEKEISRNAQLAMATVDTQPGAQYAEGSMWQLFNSVTYLTDHEIGRSADNRLYSAWYGPNQSLKTNALKLAVEMADAM